MLQEKDNEEPWYCKLCTADIFSFFGLTNQQLWSFTSYTLKTGNDIQNSQTSPKNPICSVCFKRNNKTNGLKCTTCNSFVHRKSTNLKTKEFCGIKKIKPKNWECLTCQTNKFLLTSLSDLITVKPFKINIHV